MIEWEEERREKRERRINFIVKGLDVKEEKKREALEELLAHIGAEVKIEEVSGVHGERGGNILKLEIEDQKREVMRKKIILKGRKE